jgi:hypothetical protein
MDTFEIPNLWKVVFWIVALTFSCFYSFKAFSIHLTNASFVKDQKKNKKYAWLFHQWWFNFVGAIVGWTILWVLLPSIIIALIAHNPTSISVADFLLLLIALLGITGYLPLTLFGIARNTESLISNLTTSK